MKFLIVLQKNSLKKGYLFEGKYDYKVFPNPSNDLTH